MREALAAAAASSVAWGSTWLSLYGQTGGATVDPGISSLVGNLGIMGVLVWFLWHHTTHGQPKMLASFTAEQKELRAAFAAEQAELRRVFLAEQAEQRRAFVAEQTAQRDAHRREMDEMRTMHVQALQAMRTAVHETRDAAQTALNQLGLAQAGKSRPAGGT